MWNYWLKLICLNLQALTIKPAMCWWLWSSSRMTLLRASIWIEKRKTWELVTRSKGSFVLDSQLGSLLPDMWCWKSLWWYFHLYSCCDLTLHLSQGLMFGYATDETEECMPLTIVLAHKLNAKMAELRRDGTLPWLRPDSKTQVRQRHSDLIFTKSHLFYLMKCYWSLKLIKNFI